MLVELLTFLVGAAYKSTADISRDFFDPHAQTSVAQSFLKWECIYNQQCYGTMDTAGGFSASIWSRIQIANVLTVAESGDGRGGHKYSESSQIGAAFANSARTRQDIDKWRWQTDLARQIGLESRFQMF